MATARRRIPNGRTAMSGGLRMETPRNEFGSILKYDLIAQLTDHSDDLEYALDELNLHEWDAAGDASYDLPEARALPSASGTAGRGPHPPEAPPAA